MVCRKIELQIHRETPRVLPYHRFRKRLMGYPEVYATKALKNDLVLGSG